jgi:hypothetical protein
MALLYSIPKRFYDDHVERDLPAPPVLYTTARLYVIAGDDPTLAELLDDARFYADADGPDEQPRGLKTAARALLHAVAKKGVV